MIRSPKHRIGPLLSLSAALAGVLALEVMAGPFFVPEVSSVSPDAKNSVVFPRESPAEKPAISTFAEVVERPLFTPSRRPPPKTDSNPAAIASKPETFDLIGVIISADRRMALLRTVATSEVMRAVEGQSIGGWEVRAIKPTQVVLRRGDDSEVIKIKDAASNSAVNNPSAPKSPPVSAEAGSPNATKIPPPPETPGEGVPE
jgi:type II secretory pathway component PulC